MSAALRSFKTASVSRLRFSAVANGSARRFHSSPLRAEHFLKADATTFESAISATRSKDKVVLADFYADWCNPCKMLSPILDKLTSDPSVQSGSGRSLDLVTVDTDADDGLELGQQYQIRALPTVIAFRDGKPVDQFVGALNESAVRSFLQRV